MALPVVLSIIGMIMNSRKNNQPQNLGQLQSIGQPQPNQMRTLDQVGQYGNAQQQVGNALGNVQTVASALSSLRGNQNQTPAYQMPYLRRRQ